MFTACLLMLSSPVDSRLRIGWHSFLSLASQGLTRHAHASHGKLTQPPGPCCKGMAIPGDVNHGRGGTAYSAYHSIDWLH